MGEAAPVLIRPLADESRRPGRLRLVTATSLFDGHDASINIIRRILQSSGAEVIHLGHNRSVAEIVEAAIQEDADAIALSSYQGGHLEFFKYLVDELRRRGAGSIRIFGGGGGVIRPAEIRDLESYGVTRIYAPEDGQRLGLKGMVADLIGRCRARTDDEGPDLERTQAGDRRALARLLTAIENETLSAERRQILLHAAGKKCPVLGITGTGGSGKSSLTDELLRRFRRDCRDTLDIAVLAIDPSRRKSGGALLGDRIRMNAIDAPNIFMRSLATREAASEIPAALGDMLRALRAAAFDLIIVETPGIGQGDAAIMPYADVALYVMTPEFGAATQLEKIEMLDAADLVAINKFDRPGAEDALRDVRKQVQRNREAFAASPEDMPVFGTIASHLDDPGVSALYRRLVRLLRDKGLKRLDRAPATLPTPGTNSGCALIPPSRRHYLAEIAATVRGYRRRVEQQAAIAREIQHLTESRRLLLPATIAELDRALAERKGRLDPECARLLAEWPEIQAYYSREEARVDEGARAVAVPPTHESLAGTPIPRVALPRFHDHGDLLEWLLLENVPGRFPYTAGVFAFKRADEEATRMFAGEGAPERTNRRFRLLSGEARAKRLSTAFDSVTLYGCDPDERPDIYGKIGNAGVSIATLDDMKALFEGFDLCDPKTSVSMTINGPAPAILAMFFNAAIEQQIEKFEHEQSRAPTPEEREAIRAAALKNIRGTVQADILKEDQGQNTCIFSTDFSLKMMGDVQAYFIAKHIRHFYSASISGYHIAEAGANPVTQLAFTLANGFTYVEAYLARGMAIDDFAPNLSFFFSNGMEPEYAVLGRVARRIWAVALRERYGANARSRKLKYHVQTSGRSLHAREMDFNDIRTTLQALIAVYDHCNSLHTNAGDEAITTPTEESVRRALAIQLIINREWGLSKNENPNQGAFIIERLTELVEEAVLQEFERLSRRGGVLGAMETGYQRGKIQEESLLYEARKHEGSLPVVGVNLFRNPDPREPEAVPLARSSEAEKQEQMRRLRAFKERHRQKSGPALERVKQAALGDENVFAVLMDAVRCCTLGQITEALFEVGGRYRRNM